MHVANTPAAPLFGLGFSSLPCGDIQLHGNGLTGSFRRHSSIPEGAIAGGIGVDGADDRRRRTNRPGRRHKAILGAGLDNGQQIYISGIQLPWIGVDSSGRGPRFPIDADPRHRHAQWKLSRTSRLLPDRFLRRRSPVCLERFGFQSRVARGSIQTNSLLLT